MELQFQHFILCVVVCPADHTNGAHNSKREAFMLSISEMRKFWYRISGISICGKVGNIASREDVELDVGLKFHLLSSAQYLCLIPILN
jgi:hypothetical protein